MERISPANEIAFRVNFTGYSGHLRVEPLPPFDRPNVLNSLSNLVLAHALEPEDVETIKKDLEDDFLFPELDSDEFSPEKCGKQWDFDWFNKAKVHLEPSVPRSMVVPLWELPFKRSKRGVAENEGKMNEFPLKCQLSEKTWIPNSQKIALKELMEGAQDPSSMLRMPGPAKDFVRGSINSRPFHPGGLEFSQNPEQNIPEGACNGEWVREVLEGGPAQEIPPSFKQGLDLGSLKEFSCTWKSIQEQKSTQNSSDDNMNRLSVQFDDLFKKAWEEDFVQSEGDEESVGNSVEADSNMSGSEGEKEDEVASTPARSDSILLDEILHDQQEESKPDEVASTPARSDSILLDEILHDQQEESKPDEAAGTPARSDSILLDEILHDQQEGSKPTMDSEAHDRLHKEAWALIGRTEDISKNCHQLVPDMALEFPFELDKFQKEAIYYLERGESVFVAAHTSAGKTVVAEYAFALASKHCTRAVYTAPIKTISNQKYRDFCGKFDVGLLTGDVSLRPEASCLIMTTEILRSMLYRGADIIRDIEWVIFDEVHYVNDVERGVVWEEVIIMLPRHVNIVLLSATVPNTIEFADWIGRTKKKKIRVTGTSRRPVPLEHHLFYSGELYKICESEAFLPQGVKAAKDYFKMKNSTKSRPGSGTVMGPSGAHGMSQGRQHENYSHGKGHKVSGHQKGGNMSWASGPQQANSNMRRSESFLWVLLINKLSKKALLPVVIFCFSKNRCDKSADSMTGMDLTSSSEKSDIRIFCDKAFSRLKGSDKDLPQVVRVQSLLRRGIGVHHAGLLPIVKEVVEMLFCRGVLKVLFSTETFAMGVNAPARTVEDMLKRSFAEFHAQKTLPEKQRLLLQKLAQPTKDIECIKGEPAIEDYYKIAIEAEKYREHILEVVMQSQTAHQFLSPGRVVVVKSRLAHEHILGVILKTPAAGNKHHIVFALDAEYPRYNATTSLSNKFQDKESGNFPQGVVITPKAKRRPDEKYFLTTSSHKGSGVINITLPHKGNAAGVNYVVMEVESNDILSICNCKIKIDQVRLLEDVSTAACSRTVQQLVDLKKQDNKFPPAVDPVKDLKLKDMDLVFEYNKYNNLLQKMAQSKCHGCIKLEQHIALLKEQTKHIEEVNALKFEMSDEALQQMPDFQGRIDVLKEIGCVDSDLVVQIKGRVACEMNSGEELICTECLFENQLDDLEPAEAVALMSALVFQQRNTSEPSLTHKLDIAKKRLYETAIRLGQLQEQYGLLIGAEEYAQDNLKFGLVEVVYEWAKGTPFAQICNLTDVPEGLIVRTIVRLDETCREFRNAAAIMGNSALYKKMEAASNAIKRDIVFAASLYITGI
ncbi:hypothetical protein AMTRI_Chr08g160190 [Amborella trichopoda]